MPHHKSTYKRVKTNLQRQLYNNHYKSKMKTAIKTVLNITDKEKAVEELNRTYSLLDRLARKKIIHPGKAANQKSRLAKHVSSL